MNNGILDPEEISALSETLEGKTPQEILAWAVERFSPDIALSSSFQTQSLPLLHMLVHVAPDVRVFFLDTGYHFWETLLFREMIERIWKLNVVNLYMDETWNVFCRRFGRDLPMQDPNLCCYIHKVHPMQQAVKGLRAWVSGIRRDQTEHRATAQILELQNDGLVKVNPLLNWTRQDILDYVHQNELPVHPLFERGYHSIGCAPCTRPVDPGENERAGRWAGRGKSECGLHTGLFNQEGPNPDDLGESFILKLDL